VRRLWLCGIVLLAGCGSAPAPPPAGPAAAVVTVDGHRARLDGRARTLSLYSGDRRVARVPAGLGPVAVAAGDDRVYVTDRVLGALLVFDFTPRLELQRRVHLPGGPTAIAADLPRGRLWVALTDRDEVAQLTADGAGRLVAVHPTIRRPTSLTLDRATGALTVRGAGGARQVLARRTP
jgi:hypothetical protein